MPTKQRVSGSPPPMRGRRAGISRAAWALAILLGAAAMLALSTPAAAQAGDYTLTLVIQDPTMPTFEHIFEVDAATVTATHESPGSIVASSGSVLNANYIPTSVIASSATCDNPFIAVTTTEVYGLMPQTDVTCTFLFDRSTGVEIVTVLPDDPDRDIAYLVEGAEGVTSITQSDGDRDTIAVPSNSLYSISQWPPDPNLLLVSVECIDDGATTVPGFIRAVDLNLAPGEVAVCTFTYLALGSAELTVVFESDDPAAALVLGDPLSGSTIEMDPGDSFSRTTDPTQAILHPTAGFTSPADYPLEASCEGDQGVLTIGADGLSGLAPAGANVTCTFTALMPPPPSDPMVTLLTDVRGVLDPTFVYEFAGAGFSESVTQGRDGSTTVSIPADTPVTLSTLQNGDWIPALWCTDVLGAVDYSGGAGSAAEVTLAAGDALTCTYSHTLDQTSRKLLVVNAPDYPEARFEFRRYFSTVEIPHGQAGVFTDEIETWIHPDDLTFDVLCSGTAPAPSITDRDYDLSMFASPGDPGEVLVCVLEATKVEQTRVAFAVEAINPSAEVRISDPYEGRTLIATPTSFPSTLIVGESIYFRMKASDGYDVYPGECTGPGMVRFADFGGSPIPAGAILLEGAPVPGTTITCTLIARAEIPADLYPTVTCLAGNGRIDMNVQNSDSVPHTYQVEIGALSPRVRTVASADWWRSPVTGRPDGPLPVRVLKDGVVIFDDWLVVDCDGDNPTVSSPEIQVIGACRGGDGFVAWQFANPTGDSRSYVIEFEGLPNRSTSAAPYGASVRGVSGRPDGSYEVAIRADGVIVEQGTIVVNCD